MAEVVYYVASSVDGFIAPPDGTVEWLEPFRSTDTDYGFADFLSGIDALIMGSRTYEQTLTFGPAPYAGRPVLVMSSRRLPGGEDVEVTDVAPAEAVDWLAAAGASRIWLVGGGELAGSFARAGLVDRYVVSVMPVLLGSGVPMLGTRGAPGDLVLERTEVFGGVVQCTYTSSAGTPTQIVDHSPC